MATTNREPLFYTVSVYFADDRPDRPGRSGSWVEVAASSERGYADAVAQCYEQAKVSAEY